MMFPSELLDLPLLKVTSVLPLASRRLFEHRHNVGMQTANRILLALLAVSALSIASATAFTVDPPSQNRSSLVRLRGPSFGATQGTVAIAGLPVLSLLGTTV